MPVPNPEGTDVLERAATWLAEGHRVALARVIDTWGSSPRPRGSVLAVRSDGNFAGSVSGGCVEGKVVEAAQQVLEGGPPRVLTFGVSNEEAWQVGLACGGTIRVYVEPVQRERFEALLRARRAKRPLVLFTELATGDAQLWTPGDSPLEGARAQAARTALATDDAFSLEAGALFVQAFNPPLRLVLIGAVHISEALAAYARIAGYDVTVIDPRAAFVRRELFPGVEVIAEWPDEVLERLHLDHRTALITITHDPKIDDPALEVALRSPAFYLGALGSAKTHAGRLARLAAKGFSEGELRRIHGPVGLKIGARTPAEVALSALAEVTLTLRTPGGA